MASIPVRLPIIWIPDNRIHKCTFCNSEFSVVNRKHHCRSCGKIFCSNCCCRYQSLPSYIPKTHARFCDGLLHRVCETCNTEIKYVKRSKKLILIVSLLPLPIRDIARMRTLSSSYKTAVDSVISVFKAIQYKSSYQQWSGLERRLLKTHWMEFHGHARLMTQSLRGLYGIVDTGHMCRHFKGTRSTPYDCTGMFCDKAICSQSFNNFDVLELLCAFPCQQLLQCQELESWVGTCIVSMDKKWLNIFLPFLLQSGYQAALQRIIVNNVIPVIFEDITLCYKFYFECSLLVQSQHKHKSYFSALIDRFLSVVSIDIKRSIEKTETLIYKLKRPETLKNEYSFKGIRMPFDPSIVVEDIHTVNMIQLNTYTKPWVVPMATNKGPLKILLKTDDLRKDRFVMDVIDILTYLFKDMRFKTYHCMPLTDKFGIVEMIENSKTLFDINKTTNIANYIIRNNINSSMLDIRKTFVESCATNCVLGYMLGVGDRNLGNILVCTDGNLVHIDFSYLLGTDPKSELLTQMRITPGMLDLLGGKDSVEFGQLKQKCCDLYSQLKPYTYFWYTLFTYLGTCSPPIEPHYGQMDEIQMHVEKRLMPESTEDEIAMNITDVIDKNSGSQVAGWVDTFHSLKSSVEDMMMFNLTF